MRSTLRAKFDVTATEDGKEIVPPGRDFIFSLGPVDRAGPEHAVVVFLVFHEFARGHEASDDKGLLLKEEGGEQSRNAAVAVAKGMDAEEIKHKRCQQH